MSEAARPQSRTDEPAAADPIESMALRPDDLADDGYVPEQDERIQPGPGPRRVVTQPYDLAVQTLVDQIDDRSLALTTDFQRNYVWDDTKASRLIESLLLNIPIPVCYFSEDQAGMYEVVDGHQRLHSVWRYMKGDFPLRGLAERKDLLGLRFIRLPSSAQRDLQRRTIRCVVITRESDPELKFDVFERLNTNAVPLNAQELRNCIYRGDMNQLLRELVGAAPFRGALDRAQPDLRMRDHELVLRFFTLRDSLPNYRPPLKGLLNRFMDRRRRMAPEEVGSLRTTFTSTASAVYGVFGSASFRRVSSGGHRLESNVNRALFDSQMLCFSFHDADSLVGRRSELLRGQAQLLTNDEFQESIELATADRSRLLTRLHMTADMMSELGFPIDADRVFGSRQA